MDRQAAGFMAVMLLWRGFLAEKDFDLIVDGAYYLAEALGQGRDELAEAVSIAKKYQPLLKKLYTVQSLDYRGIFEKAVKLVEEEIGEPLMFMRSDEKWII